jgi:hypothetical protein
MIRTSLTALLLGTALCAAQAYTPIDLAGVANARFDSPGFLNGSDFPTGNAEVVFDGVPYRLPATGNYLWHSASAFNPGSLWDDGQSVTIPVGLYGVGQVYTLMGQWWGTDSGSWASIRFVGSRDTITWVMTSGAELRSYTDDPQFPGTLSWQGSQEVWNNGLGQHIDRQLFDLHALFGGLYDDQTLQSVVLSEAGNDGQQRSFIAALTVNAVPEPQTWLLMTGGLALTGWAARRRRDQGRIGASA